MRINQRIAPWLVGLLLVVLLLMGNATKSTSQSVTPILASKSNASPLPTPSATLTSTAPFTDDYDDAVDGYEEDMEVGSPIAALLLLVFAIVLLIIIAILVVIGVVLGVALFILVVLLLILVGLIIVVGLLTSSLALALAVLIFIVAIVSFSALIGLYYQRAGPAILAFFIQIGAIGGTICGLGAVWAVDRFWELQLTFWAVALAGGSSGFIIGVAIGALVGFIIKSLYKWVVEYFGLF